MKYLALALPLLVVSCEEPVMQPSPKTERSEANLTGQVKKLTVKVYENRMGIVGKRLSTNITEYDPQGYLIRSERWQPVKGSREDLLTEYYLYTNYYDDNGVLIKRIATYSNDDYLHSYLNFRVEREGLEEILTVYEKDESVKAYFKTEYRYDGNPDVTYAYVGDELVQTTTYKYDKEGRETEQLIQSNVDPSSRTLLKSSYTFFGKADQMRYDGDSATPTVESQWIKQTDGTYSRVVQDINGHKMYEKYDSHFNLTETSTLQEDGTVYLTDRSYKLTYDSQGNWVEMRTIDYKNESASSYVTRAIEYF